MNISLKSRIETKEEVKWYLENLKYNLDNGAVIDFAKDRRVDDTRDIKYTNKYTVADLFPNEEPLEALRHELRKLRVEEYIRTCKDLNHPERNEYREFGRVYDGKGDVYIKIRVEVINKYGYKTVFTMSFHYATKPLKDEVFPYAQ